jgi:hypothetical protein
LTIGEHCAYKIPTKIHSFTNSAPLAGPVQNTVLVKFLQKFITLRTLLLWLVLQHILDFFTDISGQRVGPILKVQDVL